MAKLYKKTDRITYAIGDIKVKVSPMTLHTKLELTKLMRNAEDGSLDSIMNASIYALKSCIKGLSGVENQDGSPYELQFDDNGSLTDDCVEELLNLEESSLMIGLCSSLLAGIKTDLPNGISLVEPGKL